MATADKLAKKQAPATAVSRWRRGGGGGQQQQPLVESEIEEDGWEVCDDSDVWELCGGDDDDDGASSMAASSEWLDLAEVPEDDELLGAWLAARSRSSQVRGAWAKKAEAVPTGSSSRGARPPGSGTRMPPLCKAQRQPLPQGGDDGFRPETGEGHEGDRRAAEEGEAWRSKSSLPFRSQPRRKRKK